MVASDVNRSVSTAFCQSSSGECLQTERRETIKIKMLKIRRGVDLYCLFAKKYFFCSESFLEFCVSEKN